MEGILLLEYWLVGIFCKKLILYGWKLYFRGVFMLLLFFVFMSEFLNINNVGMVMFFGGFCFGDGFDGYGYV